MEIPTKRLKKIEAEIEHCRTQLDKMNKENREDREDLSYFTSEDARSAGWDEGFYIGRIAGLEKALKLLRYKK